jgi:hypothetical protein
VSDSSFVKVPLVARIMDRAKPWDSENAESAPVAGGRRAGNVIDLSSEGNNSRPRGGIKKMLVATDRSPRSTKAVEQAVTLARQCAATLTILLVIDINLAAAYTYAGSAETLRQNILVEAAARVARLADSLAQAQVEAQICVVEGLPGEEIAQ